MHDLNVVFQALEELAAPPSTRMVREESGIGLRDGKEGVIELTPLFFAEDLLMKEDGMWKQQHKETSKCQRKMPPFCQSVNGSGSGHAGRSTSPIIGSEHQAGMCVILVTHPTLGFDGLQVPTATTGATVFILPNKCWKEMKQLQSFPVC